MINKLTQSFALTGTIILLCTTAVFAQKGVPPEQIVSINHTTNYPQVLEFRTIMINKLKAAPGWKVSIVASGLGKPRMLYTIKPGELYVTRRDAGEILLLKDTDGDMKFDELMPVVAEFKGVHGITIKDGWLYGCSNRELMRYKLTDSGTVSQMELLINDLPDGGQHGNRTMEFGPDGMLYLSVGSTCNDCFETNKENATMLQIDPATWKRTVYARGLRNTIGFDWNPATKELWGFDNGADAKGDDIAPEELNKIEKDHDYGWPLSWGKQKVDNTREDPPGTTKEQAAKNSTGSTLEFTAHSAPISFRFIDANTGVICWHGSWDRKSPSGYKAQMISFKNGVPVAGTDFLSGFFNAADRTTFGRPSGITVDKNGVVFISDDTNGIIYAVQKSNSARPDGTTSTLK